MKETDSLVASNQKAHFQYEIVETLETGIVLKGSEIKSIREHSVTIAEAWVQVLNGELLVRGMRIPVYSHASFNAPEPERLRKLLAHKKQITQLEIQIERKGMSLIPLKLYFKKGRLKMLIGLGKGKTHFDKRSDLKEKDEKRSMQRAMKNNNPS
jgi:SsrA-binding protein